MADNLFGVVFQKDALFDSLLVWQNVMFQSLGSKENKNLILKSKKYLKLLVFQVMTLSYFQMNYLGV
jgi:ABC-type transporter Mla maintaining outer membrane lipid asymmetry ATPase subunit MlaF